MIKRQKNKEPELENDFKRFPDLGYEPEGTFGIVRCLEHGVPNPLIRWHYHEEYELHLIVETSGKVFIGDYIGAFEPGHLVLTGPRLPHNWISTDVDNKKIKIRDRVLQFRGEPLRAGAEIIPELSEALPLLDRAKHGIEFIGIDEEVNRQIQEIKQSRGLERFSIFLKLIKDLAKHQNYRLLSNSQRQSYDDDASLRQISEIVDYITANYATNFTMQEVAQRFSMGNSQFSRFFRRATGNTFTDFVNILRINKACKLLMTTEQYVSTICYNVGFNNIANFNRRFMEIKDMTPSDFRKQGEARFGTSAQQSGAATGSAES